MPRILLVLWSYCLATFTSNGQTTTITYSATYGGVHIALDSILVMNLVQGGDTMLYGLDTVLVLGSTTGVTGSSSGLDIGRISCHPNPFEGQTTISMDLGSEQDVSITVTNLMGTAISHGHHMLSAGSHLFSFESSREGVRLITFATKEFSRTVRALAHGTGAGVADVVRYMGNAVSGVGVQAKDVRTLFSWTTGDELRSIGYVTLPGNIVGSGAVESAVVASELFTFNSRPGRFCTVEPWMIDQEGTRYDAMEINGGCWMSSDLRTSHYANGDVIPQVITNEAWIATGEGAWCHYGNNPLNDATYGKLYTAYTVLDPRGVCPSGWHVATNDDWAGLELAAGMPPGLIGQFGWRGVEENVAAGITSTSDAWMAVPPCATDALGFNGVPEGTRQFTDGQFVGLGEDAFWWLATGWGGISEDGCGIYRDGNSSGNATSGMSIRCVRD